jgi:phospholipid/cholesterol/gamma-HCH transport system ATP-binding protein
VDRNEQNQKDAALRNDHAIVLQDVCKAFEEKIIHDGVALAVRNGEIMTILGGSGQGKTVLLKAIMGLTPLDSGRVYVHGEDIAAMDESKLQAVRGDVAMVFQGSALFDSLTVGENVAYGLRERRRQMPDKEVMRIVAEKLKLVGLSGTEELFPAELSGGMKKRVAVARALALEPSIILYDEPSTGLDPANVRRINGLILKLRDTMKVTSIMVTHDMASVEIVTDRVALLDNGRIIAVGTWDEMEHSDDVRVHQFLGGDFGE